MHSKLSLPLFSVYITFLCVFADAELKQPVTPADCVGVRYLLRDDSRISPIQFDPQGNKIAYLVKAPNLDTNTNNIELYVRDIWDVTEANDPPLLSNRSLSMLHWSADGERLVALVDSKGATGIEEVDVRTGQRKNLVHLDQNIVEYTIDQGGGTIVFATEVPIAKSGNIRSEKESESGYRVPFDDPQTSRTYHREIFVTHLEGGEWSTPKPIAIRSPFTHDLILQIPYYVSLSLSLSPDGRQLLLTYADHLSSAPENWKKSPFLKASIENGGDIVQPTALYDLQNETTALAFNGPQSDSVPTWSPNGRAFVIISKSPIGSPWEDDDVKQHREYVNLNHLFWVEPKSGKVEEVAPFVWSLVEQPLVWTKNDRLDIHILKDQVGHFEQRNGAWTMTSSFKIPDLSYLNSRIASNGRVIVGTQQSATIAPRLFQYVPGEKNVKILTDLNPLFQSRQLAQTKTIEWKTSTGYTIKGLLWLPIDYRAGTRYPLVIQTKSYTGGFSCDSGEFHYPSFAPEPMAGANLMYLAEIYNEDPGHYTPEQQHYPKGYPGIQGIGGVGEAAFEMDKWEGAVQKLEADGLIDENKVGIIGFSRSGWYTEFSLAHSRVKYRAATIADNAEFNLIGYWTGVSKGTLRGYENMYGGPPYGATLKNWMNYSISFTVDRIHTPLLIEQMGYGIAYDNKLAPPLLLLDKFEIFTALTHLGRPVELYYYPRESHEPDSPKGRLATLQRNLDWYRFWLQSYERPYPNDSDQYLRWRAMASSLHGETPPGASPQNDRQ